LKKSSTTKNTTLLRLKNTPFSTAADLKANEDRILMEEWERVERAKQRRLQFRKEENAILIAPYKKGWGARFVGIENAGNLVKVYMDDDDQVQIDIDDSLKSKDAMATVDCLVRSVAQSFIRGYNSTLGLDISSDDDPLQNGAGTPEHRPKNK